ncbi:MAG: hypothetical protein AW07_01313 [Candidatus Accumulibacter sp. SK-11]|nr:MAG: hypothetical protein AW07_01313 [Candidatus Accumulibacter sp. SK-11]
MNGGKLRSATRKLAQIAWLAEKSCSTTSGGASQTAIASGVKTRIITPTDSRKVHTAASSPPPAAVPSATAPVRAAATPMMMAISSRPRR